MGAAKVEIVIPCYNEADVLRESVQQTLALFAATNSHDWRLTIADNGSQDGTTEIARELAARHDAVHTVLISRRGKGAAVKQAWAESDADVVGFMDADLSTDLAQLPELVNLVQTGQCDIAIGSRMAKGARAQRSRRREMTSRAYGLLLRLFFPRLNVTDAQCGFKAVNRRVVDDVMPLVRDRRWFFDTEMLILAHREGLRVREIPVTWHEGPNSKVRLPGDALDFVAGLLRMRFRRLGTATRVRTARTGG